MTDQIQETIRFYQWLKLAELVRFNSFSKLLKLSSFTFQETFEDDKTLSRFSWYFDLVLEHFTCSENTNLYREIIKVVRHFLRRNYSRLRRLYRVRLTWFSISKFDHHRRPSELGASNGRNKDYWDNKNRLARSTTSSRTSPLTPCSMILTVWDLFDNQKLSF